MVPGTVAENTLPANETLVRFDTGPSTPLRNQPRSVRSLMSHGSWNDRVAKSSAAATAIDPPRVTDCANNCAGMRSATRARKGAFTGGSQRAYARIGPVDLA